MCIKNDLQKKKYNILCERKNNLKYLKVTKKSSLNFFYIKIFFFFLQNVINIFFILYYDYWDLITKIWPGSLKLNTSFVSNSWQLASSTFYLNLLSFCKIISCFTSRNLPAIPPPRYSKVPPASAESAIFAELPVNIYIQK